MHFKIYTVIYLQSIVKFRCSPAYLLFEVTLNFPALLSVAELLCGCLLEVSSRVLIMVFTGSKVSCRPSLRMLKCLSPLESLNYFLLQSELAGCKGSRFCHFGWILSDFPLLPLALQRLSVESCVSLWFLTTCYKVFFVCDRQAVNIKHTLSR